MQKRRDEKPEETLAYQRAYRAKNKDKIKAQRRLQQRRYYGKNKAEIYRRSRSNPSSKLIGAVRGLTASAYKRRGFKKNTKTFTILQCSQEQFIAHIESQFTQGMTQENFGDGGWDIDHVIPIAAAVTEEHVSILSHYLNLQPLWREDNKEKSDTIVPKMVIPVLRKLIPIFGKESFIEMLRGSEVECELQVQPVTLFPSRDPSIVRESSRPALGLKGLSNVEAIQRRADRVLAPADFRKPWEGNERARCLPPAAEQPAGARSAADESRRNGPEDGRAASGAPEGELQAK
jgi:hypothetical protein